MRHAYDFYPTPHWVTESILPYLTRGIVWHEPACGDGAIVSVLRASNIETTASDIRFGDADFLRDTAKREAIITNPPFSLAFEFCQRAVKLAPEVMLLLRLNFLSSQYRAAWFKQHEPDALFVLSRRPSFTNNGKTDSTDYAWFYWGSTLKGIHHI